MIHLRPVDAPKPSPKRVVFGGLKAKPTREELIEQAVLNVTTRVSRRWLNSAEQIGGADFVEVTYPGIVSFARDEFRRLASEAGI